MSRRYVPIGFLVAALTLGSVVAANTAASAQIPRAAGTATRVCTGDVELMVIEGKVKGNKIPAFDLEMRLMVGQVQTPFAVVQIMMLFDSDAARAATPTPNKLVATLYNVDAQGNRTKIESQTQCTLFMVC